MTRMEFLQYHWEYYNILEEDFYNVTRYVELDLGDNNLYKGAVVNDVGNSQTYSIEFVKQYQAICSAIEDILKDICKELGSSNPKNMQYQYTPVILNDTYFKNVVSQKVRVKHTELQPFMNWSVNPYKGPDWWTIYNDVKHNKKREFKNANLKNVVNALAGLYILNMYLVKKISDEQGEQFDVPNSNSKLFEMVNWNTKFYIAGREMYCELE